MKPLSLLILSFAFCFGCNNTESNTEELSAKEFKLKKHSINDDVFAEFIECSSYATNFELIYESQRMIETEEDINWVDTIYAHIKDKQTILNIIDTFPRITPIKGRSLKLVRFLPYAHLIFKCDSNEVLKFTWNNYSTKNGFVLLDKKWKIEIPNARRMVRLLNALEELD